MKKSRPIIKVLTVSAYFVLTHLSQIPLTFAASPKSAILYYPASQVTNITPFFDFYSTDRSNNMFDYKTDNYATGVLIDYGVNSFLSIGGKLTYGEESNSQTRVFTTNRTNTISKGLSDPEFYLNTRYSFEKFRIYGNIIGHTSLENHNTPSNFDNGNMASGGPGADIELATDIPLGPITTGFLVGKTIWKDLQQVYDNSSYTKYQVKGGEVEKYKVFFELNSLNNLKPGFNYTVRKTNPSLRLIENTSQNIFYDYGQKDGVADIYARFRIDYNLVIIGSVTQINTVKNVSEYYQEAYKSYGLNLGLTLKY